jgi:excisionase family DNA binding protein
VGDEAEIGLRLAITEAKARAAAEVTADDLLLGVLRAISRFGTVALGPWTIDLEEFGVDWLSGPPKLDGKVTYSDQVVEILDQAAALARVEGLKVGPEHLLVPFARESEGLMGQLKRRYGIDSAAWRGALAAIRQVHTAADELRGAPSSAAEPAAREYLSPEEAAAFLGVHVQTIRGYIRSKKLEALRIAGERAIRIRRSSLEKLLEPLDAGDTPAA